MVASLLTIKKCNNKNKNNSISSTLTTSSKASLKIDKKIDGQTFLFITV